MQKYMSVYVDIRINYFWKDAWEAYSDCLWGQAQPGIRVGDNF